MKKTLLVLVTLVGLSVALIALSLPPPEADAAPPKNLKVLKKDLTKKEIKKIMKGWAKALGVECDFCHDMDDMAKDTKYKKVARKMYRMMNDINTRHMKKYETKVTCKTCHQGKEHPEK